MSRTPIEWIDRKKDAARLGLELTPELHERLKNFCSDSGISMSDFVRLSISNMLNKMQ